MKILRFLKKTAAVLAIPAILLASLVSCSSTENVIYCSDDSGKTVAAMNENMFSFHLSENKSFYLYSLGAKGDSAEFWNRQAAEDGKTIGDMTFSSIVNNAKEIVAAACMYEDMKNASGDIGKVLSEADTEIEKQIDSYVSQLISVQGSKSALESYLSQFAIDIKNLRSYYGMYFRMSAVQATFTASEDEKKQYFNDNYSIVKHILINTTFKVKDDGSRVSLSQEEKDKQLARADALNARLAAGEDFDVLWALPEYQDADAAGAAKYPEGYFVCKNSSFTVAFEEAALDMEVGEIRTVTSDYGIHIMKKYPMDAEKYNLYSDVYSALGTAASNENFNQALAPYIEKVQVNQEVLSNFSVVNAPIMQ